MERRDEYMTALESVRCDGDIGPLARLVGGLVASGPCRLVWAYYPVQPLRKSFQ